MPSTRVATTPSEFWAPDSPDDLFESVFEAYPEGVVVLSPDGVVLRINGIAAELLDVAAPDVVGRRVAETPLGPALGPSVMTTLQHGSVSRVHELPGGRRIAVSTRPVSSGRHTGSCILVMLRDAGSPNERKTATRRGQIALGTSWVDLRRVDFDDDEMTGFVAASSPMRQAYESALECAEVRSPVLLLGETGTGKSLFARLIHRLSGDGSRPFHEINCGALPEGLIEAELFGYSRGAFTGADSRGKPGLIELAHTGTLLLDEVGDLPLTLQVKLLKFLETGEIWSIGASKAKRLDVRLVAATNGDLIRMMNEGAFRKDLFYRLNVLTVRLPSLRERFEEIPALVEMMLARLDQQWGRQKTVSDEALTTLCRYGFPGNVRELWNIVERLVVGTKKSTIDADDLPEEVRSRAPSGVDEPRKLRRAVEGAEVELLREALARFGTQAEAARHLGVAQATVARKAKRYGLGRP